MHYLFTFWPWLFAIRVTCDLSAIMTKPKQEVLITQS